MPVVEFNTYLCQSSGLIRKDILYLAKVVCEVPATSEGRLVELVVVYLSIKVYKRGLAGAYELDGDVEGDGDDVLEGDEGKGPGNESVDGGVVVGPVIIVQPRGVAWVVPVFEHGVDDGACYSHTGEDD